MNENSCSLTPGMLNNTSKTTHESAYFAFIDILGFSQIVCSLSHEELEKVYFNLIQASVGLALSGGHYRFVEKLNQRLAVPDTSKALVNSLLVSDSILVWTENDSMKSFIDLIAVVRNLMRYSFCFGMPLRGAISIGPATFFSGRSPSPMANFHFSLFGKPIVEAATLEKQQQWSGCIVDLKAVDCYRKKCSISTQNTDQLATVDYLCEKGLIARYPAPMKIGGGVQFVENYVINWVTGTKTPESDIEVVGAFSKHKKSIDQPSVRQKIENTFHFVRTMTSSKV
jgi:hypothetical protein